MRLEMRTRHARRTLLFQERLYLWDSASHPNLQGVLVSLDALCSRDGESERRRKQRLGGGGGGMYLFSITMNQYEMPINSVPLSVVMRWIPI